MYPAQYLARPSYIAPGMAEPTVDLGALRRQWPQALQSQGDRVVLLGYMRDSRRVGSGSLAQESVALAVPTVEQLPDFATAIPAASAADGQQVAQRCLQCHVWDKGGPNKIGPDLYGLIGRPRASHPGFAYSSAMTAKGGAWTYAELYRFLRSPAGYIPGTKMTFVGLPRAQDRLNLIAFMRSWADAPPPLPPKAAQSPAEPGAQSPKTGKKS